ncbi:copper resistance protein NlpE [Shewanella sp. NIFS-20-20]|uniref:copper resistance protein NlpE n=1 Tax=Shewanella sp. NIFS-20-20 TaxID=2853806 RepID=UPI001C453401|nr:copper resistance protein NlpE [Shewanella sp. NIFS-20-20]MBV7314847.1 copper resistance protein NlpE [Shewanella sp. NIFS-20-20]
MEKRHHLGVVSVAVLCCGLLLGGCQPASDPADNPAPTADKPTASPQTNATVHVSIGDSSKTSLDWPGEYRGTLPCASCEGILTVITLQSNDRYQISSTYQGSDPVVFDEHGKFSWNAAGNTITLTNGNQYLVGENRLLMLNQDGQRIQGDLASDYELAKQE